MPDRYNRPTRRELLSSHLLGLAACVPIDELPRPPLLLIRVAKRAGASASDIATALDVDLRRAETLIAESEDRDGTL